MNGNVRKLARLILTASSSNSRCGSSYSRPPVRGYGDDRHPIVDERARDPEITAIDRSLMPAAPWPWPLPHIDSPVTRIDRLQNSVIPPRTCQRGGARWQTCAARTLGPGPVVRKIAWIDLAVAAGNTMTAILNIFGNSRTAPFAG